MNLKIMMGVLLALICVTGVHALVVDFADGCTSGQEVLALDVNGTPVTSPYVTDNCTGTTVLFIGANLTALGPILPGELAVTPGSVFVDSILRPDLDVPAVIVFSAPYVFEPNVLKDGVACIDCNATFDSSVLKLTVEVTGFSNYSLTGQQDFTVQSDTEPVLAGKVYQTIDLGDARRAEEYKCLVQLYGKNAGGQWVLVETNPQRQVQAKLLGNPDPNQPEALGYFKTENGLANVYFNGDNVYGYENFEYVAQCANNSTKLIYEENIDTRYKQPGKALISRGVWLTDNGGLNAFYGSIVVIVGFFAVLFALVILRTWWRVLRGY